MSAHDLRSLPTLILLMWLAVVALLRLVNLGFEDLQAWDEGLYAHRALMILQHGNWIDQSAHSIGGLITGCYPPLAFWFTAVSYSVFGPTEWTTRLFSSVTCVGSVFLLFLIVRKFSTTRAAAFAGILLGTNLFFSFYSRQGQLDVGYIFFILLSVWGWLCWTRGRGRKVLVIVAVAIAGAFMTKILMGVYTLIILVALHFLVDRSTRPSYGHLFLTLLTGTLLAFPWHVWMYYVHGDVFFDAFFSLHIAQRAMVPLEGHNSPLGVFFYFNQIIVRYPEFVLSGGLFIFWMSSKTARIEVARPLLNIALIWTLSVLVIISAVSTKIVHYSLPLAVPAAMLGGVVLDSMVRGSCTRKQYAWALFLYMGAVLWGAGWPLRMYVKTQLLGIPSANADTSLSLVPFVIATVALIAGVCALVLSTESKRVNSVLRAVPFVVLGLLTLQAAYEFVVKDETQYEIGTRRVADTLVAVNATEVDYVGFDQNPALEVYLSDWGCRPTPVSIRNHLPLPISRLHEASPVLQIPSNGERNVVVLENRLVERGYYPERQEIIGDATLLFSNDFYSVYDMGTRRR